MWPKLTPKEQGLAVFFFLSRSSIPLPDASVIPKLRRPSSQGTESYPRPASAGAFPGSRANATFVTLARNSDVWEVAKSIRSVEDRFNRHHHYDWVFLNDEDFDSEFKKLTTALASGTTHYGKIPKEHWSYPDWIDQDKAKKAREEMSRKKVIYGDSESYRHMCRYESGFFFLHPLMLNYEFYWRVEPSVELFCDVPVDPFRFMKENDKKYGFVISLFEYIETIPTLWDSVKKFMSEHPEHIADSNAMDFISDDGGKTFNKCHFVSGPSPSPQTLCLVLTCWSRQWSNFEIASLDWLRSKSYMDYFSSLDHDGGFYYERWGDAPVHSIGAAVLLRKEQIHFFNEIGYFHVPFTHCPSLEQTRLDLKCHCKPSDNFDWKGFSCKSATCVPLFSVPLMVVVDRYITLVQGQQLEETS